VATVSIVGALGMPSTAPDRNGNSVYFPIGRVLYENAITSVIVYSVPGEEESCSVLSLHGVTGVMIERSIVIYLHPNSRIGLVYPMNIKTVALAVLGVNPPKLIQLPVSSKTAAVVPCSPVICTGPTPRC
jgi:hypothetical protein